VINDDASGACQHVAGQRYVARPFRHSTRFSFLGRLGASTPTDFANSRIARRSVSTMLKSSTDRTQFLINVKSSTLTVWPEPVTPTLHLPLLTSMPEIDELVHADALAIEAVLSVPPVPLA
jgi:hypothetical protein